MFLHLKLCLFQSQYLDLELDNYRLKILQSKKYKGRGFDWFLGTGIDSFMSSSKEMHRLRIEVVPEVLL